ncbi:UDP-N-acetylglucosamine 2-epimerase [uncultured Desulfatiglans sp.]|nr:UDP-N-acetylglucosamine 2-epimerase [uncultured Desulfatiglans sp.]
MEQNTFDLVAGARPNFMKLAPLVRAFAAIEEELEARGLGWRIVHSGQHYDAAMNDVFFSELGIPAPDVHLEVGSGTHGAQTARIIERYERHLLENRPVATVVFGDVNSTVACALAAVKLAIPVLHVEAGLRSFDRTMPEEINRVLTDALSEMLFVSERSGMENLEREGVSGDRAYLVGNVMIDTLARELPRAAATGTAGRLGVEPGGYGLMTLHRPANVDNPGVLRPLLELLVEFSRTLPVVFPVHPRTQKAISEHGLDYLLKANGTLKCIPPLPYHENLSLMSQAKVVLTDSGGMQEETTYLGVPCLTLRPNTERPVTVTHGTSRLVGNDPKNIAKALDDVMAGQWAKGQDIPLWDGKTSERIIRILVDRFSA